MKYYSYETFKKDTNKLIQKVSTNEIDAIVGIARGGLTLAHSMAEGLNLREVQSIRTELYDDKRKRKNISIYDTTLLTEHKTILVVDDIADSGETLEAVMQHFEKKYKNIKFISATLFYKKTSVYKPDFWINEANEWIEFFWEKDFSQSR